MGRGFLLENTSSFITTCINSRRQPPHRTEQPPYDRYRHPMNRSTSPSSGISSAESAPCQPVSGDNVASHGMRISATSVPSTKDSWNACEHPPGTRNALAVTGTTQDMQPPRAPLTDPPPSPSGLPSTTRPPPNYRCATPSPQQASHPTTSTRPDRPLHRLGHEVTSSPAPRQSGVFFATAATPSTPPAEPGSIAIPASITVTGSTPNPPSVNSAPSSPPETPTDFPPASETTTNPGFTATTSDLEFVPSPKTQMPYTTDQKRWLVTYVQLYYPGTMRKSWEEIQSAYNAQFPDSPRAIGGLTLIYQRFVNERADLPEPATVDHLAWTADMDAFIINWVRSRWQYGVARDWDAFWVAFWATFGSECQDLDGDGVTLRRKGEETVRIGARGKAELVGRCKDLEEMVVVKNSGTEGRDMTLGSHEEDSEGVEDEVDRESSSPDIRSVVDGTTTKRGSWSWEEEREWLRQHDTKRLRAAGWVENLDGMLIRGL